LPHHVCHPTMVARLFTRFIFGRRGGYIQRLALAYGDFRLSPKTLGVTRSASVDAAFALDEPLQWLSLVLDRGAIPHNPRPFASGSHVHSSRVGGAPDDRGERIFPLGYNQQSGSQCPTSPFHCALFSSPPSHQFVDSAQVCIDRVPPAAALAFGPGVSNPDEILPQGFGRVRNWLWLRHLFIG
jgi:hypothetical protein